MDSLDQGGLVWLSGCSVCGDIAGAQNWQVGDPWYEGFEKCRTVDFLRWPTRA